MVEGQALRECPFCGGRAKRLTIGQDEPNNAGGDVIVCTQCQASSHVEFGRKENLVSRWNARATPTHPDEAQTNPQALVEALENLLCDADPDCSDTAIVIGSGASKKLRKLRDVFEDFTEALSLARKQIAEKS